MKKIFLIILICLPCFSSAQQFICETNDPDTSLIRVSSTLEYIPDEYTSTKNVKVNFHFMMKSDSLYNFTPFDDGNGNCSFTAYDYSDILINNANSMLAQNQAMNLPLGNNTPALPTKIRLKLESVYFHYDSNSYTFFDEPTKLSWDDVAYYCEFADSQINVFFVYNESSNTTCVGKTHVTGNKSVIIGGAWQLYNTGAGASGFWGNAWLLVHEIGHVLSLHHTMQSGDICSDHDDFCLDTPLYSEVYLPGFDPCPTWNCQTPYCSNNLMDYSGHRAITPEQLGRIHYTLMNDMLLFIYDDYCSINQNELEYELDEGEVLTWENDRIMKNNLIIGNGAQLTIKNCQIHMPQGASIVVKQGGRLVLDGAVLTNKCDLMWNGIEVWGYRNENQFLQNGSYRQGYLELINGATIENAICAVQLWRPGMRAYTGGIVHADNAIFRNNSKAVKVMSYVNIDPQTNQEADYNAFFRSCTFEIDHDFLGTSSFNEHVELNGIKGISFAGCEFSTDRNLSDVSPFCNGITAYDAGFEVAHLPITGLRNDTVPRSNYVSSSFTGFYSGIDAATLGINPITFSVSRSIFDNNKFGIMAKNSSFINVVDNAFYIGDDSDCSYGVFTSGVDHFCIEDNRFESVQNTSSETYGIGVHNSSSDNHISNNTFSGLSCANAAIGQNNDGNPIGSYRPQGLLYTCNENNNNSIDFYVQSELNTVSGIRREQGSSALPAANVFSGSQYQFYNGGDYVINYYYSSIIGQAPSPTKIFQVNDIASVNTNACASRNHDLTREDLDGLEQEYLSAYQLFESASQRYSEQLDGGNTSALLSMINGATIEEIRHVKKTLLLLSPFLSEDVLSAVASREDVFNNQDVFDVYSANPDLLKDLRLLRYLEEKKDPMAPEMIDELKRRAHTVTARTELLSQMGQYSHDFTRAAEDVVRYLLKDSLADSSRIRQWLENIHDVTSDRMIVASFIREGNYNEALDLANRIPEHYGLQGRELLDHTDYVRLLELYQALFESGRSIFEMTELEVRMVEEIANAGCGYSQSLAEVLLSRVSDRISDLSCLDLPNTESDRNAASFSGVPSEDGSGPTIEITPNPATTGILIEYSIPSGMEFAELVLSNIMGMIVLNAELHGSQGQKTLDVSGLANGIYYYVFRCGEIVKTGKIVIAK